MVAALSLRTYHGQKLGREAYAIHPGGSIIISCL